MAAQLKHTIDTLEFNTVNLRLCLQDIGKEDAYNRILGGNPNSLIYVVGHMLLCRYQMANIAGLNLSNNLQPQFGLDAKCNDGQDYPDLATIKAEWDDISEKLLTKLKSLSEEEANAEIPNAFPMHKRTVAGAVAFLTWHDSYHMGQVGSIRTALGYAPPKDVFHTHMESK